MSTLITLCRDIEEPTDTECIEDHESSDMSLIAPCKVERMKCDLSEAAGHVGPEAESSATTRDDMAIQDCCDC